MTTLSDLIARLEAAKEGSREFDAWIFCAIEHQDKKPERNLFYENREEWGVFVTNAPAPGMTFHDAPHYTTSLDVALTLVPKALWIVGHQEDCFARILPPVGDGYIGSKEVSATAHTPALAICIAALKAREARR